MRPVAAVAFAFLLLPAHRAAAQDSVDGGPIHAAIAAAISTTPLVASAPDADDQTARHMAFEYSDGYKTRAKIHKYASFATLPLFATEFYLGQSIYNTPSGSKKNAHLVIGTGIMGLYGAQAVTGIWNMVEASHDPNPAGKKRRLVHSILMLASGAGFAITPMVAPGGREERFNGPTSANTHRAVAYTSIGIGTAGYLLMLFGGK